MKLNLDSLNNLTQRKEMFNNISASHMNFCAVVSAH